MSQRRIVFVELSDVKVDIIVQALTDVQILGFNIHKLKANKECIHKIINIKPSLIILDLSKNKAQGLNFIKNIYRELPTAKVVIFDDLTHQPTLIKCLEYGADEYLTFSTINQTIGYKLKNILKRDKILNDDQLVFGNICFNLEYDIVYIEDKVNYLSKTESSLLRCLMKRVDRVVYRAEIMDIIWSKPEVFPNIIDVYIEKLRRIIDKPFNTNHIKTIYGKGYMFSSDGSKISKEIKVKEIKVDEAT